ncbi:tripartite tricarboxylate transporter permease [Neotabrizicola sp. sgz301269]|uniref:tripartite tricarboxylate transporter permease n=1 Tax=Neotabrizicola sp. sgz301269 TaxID=3276282 RepID=UPI00376FDBAE
MNDIFSNMWLGLSVAATPEGLLYCTLGVFVGMVVGVLPGLGSLAAISILYPITFHVEPHYAIIMLAGIYYGTTYGGKTTAILLNVPGETDAAVVCFDGHPMAKQGRAGVALFMSTMAAFQGAAIGIVIVMLFSPVIASAALSFGSPEYFALMAMGLLATTAMSDSGPAKSIAMVLFGIVLGLAGTDVNSGVERFTFGLTSLQDGVSMVVIAMGLFGVSEIIFTFATTTAVVEKISMRSMLPRKDDLRRSVAPVLRGAAIGTFFGALPGTGSTVSTFISYGTERKVSKTPERFGKGAIEGVVGPEAAANSADMTAFIPTLTLGVPGSTSMALILSLLVMHGMTPGPRLITDHADLVWGLIMSFWIGNILLCVFNIPMIGLWVRLLRIPSQYLYPLILMFICIGTYSVRMHLGDVWMVIVASLFGVAARFGNFPAGPLLLGYVLGPMMEEHFRRTLLLSRGDLSAFFQGPICLTIYTAVILLFSFKLFRLSPLGRRMFPRPILDESL